MTQSPDKQRGRVCLVGAGPGDPELITAKGLARLRAADAVVFDALANPTLLAEAPVQAERYDAGKRAKEHRLTQDQTNALMARLAHEGKFVVRLKGGDPYLFGRGAEEVAYLASHGVDCEVVPGITAGIAGPMMAGVPVTHRDHASTVTFVTGHEDPTKERTAIDYAALARLIAAGGTACFYMGVGRLEAISTQLREHGLPDQMPVALVQWGSLPRQRSLRTTLENAAEDVAHSKIGPPAIIVVGPVAGIDEPGLDFFTRRPLFGQTVMITRTRQQTSALRGQLETLGAQVLEAPTIAIEPVADFKSVDRELGRLNEYDWLVLTSANGVSALADRLDALNLDSRALAPVKIAAIGDATAAALADRLHVRADLVPTRFVAESLAGELIAKQEVRNQRFLLLRADIARPALPKLLEEAGGRVTEAVAYETKLADALPDAALEALRAGDVDWVTFTSSSTARNMVELLGDERELLEKCKLASIGPITSDAMRELGLRVDLEASESNIPGLVAALSQAR